MRRYINFSQQASMVAKLTQVLRKFFSEFDMFNHPAVLRIKQEPEMKSLAAGIVSFLLAAFFAYVFINNSVQVLNFSQISSVQSTTLVKSKQAEGTFRMFGITLDFLDIDTFQTMFDFTVQIYQDGNYLMEVQLVECQPQHWKLLGDSYQQDYIDYDLGWMYCPDYASDFKLKQTFRSKTLTYVYVSLQACDNSSNPSCIPSNAAIYLTNQTTTAGDGASIISVFVLDQAVVPESKNPVQYYINIDTNVQITHKFGGVAIIEFSSFQVDTDINIFPIPTIQTVTGVGVTNVRNYQSSFTSIETETLGQISFVMNQKKTKYSRVVGKVDELLSYAGGLFGIIIGFMAIFLTSFNEYRYELTVAEGVFNYDESGRRVDESYLNFLRYIKYTIFDWIQVLCCSQMNWQDCKDINETRDEIVAQMEVHRIFKRIQNLEMAVKQLTNENERLCYNLISQPTLEKVKADRLVIDYYDACIGKEPPILVEDVRVVSGELLINPDKLTSEANLGPSKVGDISFNSYGGDNSFLSIQKEKEKENRKFENRENILQRIADSFPQIRKKAEEIELEEDLEETQNRLIEAFSSLSPTAKTNIQEKIPIIIVYRLMKKINKDRNIPTLIEDFKP